MSDGTIGRSERAIDAFVNVNMGSMDRPEWLERVADEYFKRADAIFRDIDVSDLVDEMDRLGVSKAILSTQAETPSDQVLAFATAHPDRFALSASIDPRRGMVAIGALQALHETQPVVLARAFPFMTGLPPNDRSYYPLYAKCVELDLPVSINTGIPGPPAPGACQHPMHLDDVCLYFPDLRLVMAHGADPWWEEAIRLMIKYPNLYLMTSAYAPKYLPESLIQYMNTRGRQKILFASDHPVLEMSRCIEEACALDLRDGVLDRYLYANANDLLFGGEQA